MALTINVKGIIALLYQNKIKILQTLKIYASLLLFVLSDVLDILL